MLFENVWSLIGYKKICKDKIIGAYNNLLCVILSRLFCCVLCNGYVGAFLLTLR